MIVIDPRMDNAGKRTKEITELLDIFPTLVDLSGIKPEKNLEGRSLRGVLEHPEMDSGNVAVSQFPCPALREWAGVGMAPNVRTEYFEDALKDIEDRIIIENPDTPLNVFQENVTGYSVRDSRYRAVIWVDWSGGNG
ncbi:hypothetical protein J0S41_23640, partial [Escherichia coli]|uniref:hypothetical protein n=1 Tax=Escherichia coli TaxID=562 RepID=UPI001A905C68